MLHTTMYARISYIAPSKIIYTNILVTFKEAKFMIKKHKNSINSKVITVYKHIT